MKSAVGSATVLGAPVRRGREALVLLGALVLATVVFLGASSAQADSPPAVTIAAPTEVSYTTAHLSGTVNPAGGPSTTFWRFEVSRDPSDPAAWETQLSGEISGPEAEESNPIAVAGTVFLPPGVEYSVRLVAENGDSANRVETQAPYPSFTTLATPPPTVTIEAPTQVGTDSAHFAGTINPGENDEAFGVLWHFECTPECPGLAEEQYLVAGTTPEPVSADAKGLQPNTTYEVSLVAVNTGARAEAGPETFTTAAAAPLATTVGAIVPEGGTTALVGGRVNPLNSPTVYWIEYGTDENYGQSAPATEDADAGSGGELKLVTQELTGLSPRTTYHFRLVAESAVGTTLGQDLSFETGPAGPPPAESCPNQALRIGPAAALPDCRGYEQVSPRDKNEGNADGGSFTADGGHVLYIATSAFAGAKRGGLNNYLAGRTDGGWETRSLTPALPLSVPQSPIPPSTTVNADGSLALVQTADPLVEADQNHETDFYLERPDGSFEWISRPTASFTETFNPAVFPGGSTLDLGHVVFQNTKRAVPAAAGLEPFAYGLYDATAGALRLVNVDSGGTLINPYGAGLGSGVARRYDNAISADGERIIFTTPASIESVPAPFDVKRIYLRGSDQTTTEISASQCSQPSCAGPVLDATYQGASDDGSVIFFSSRAQLTDAATAGGGLYRYEVGSGDLTLLTPDATDPGGAGVEGAVGNSDDGSVIYFVATGKLADGATLGADNLYVYDGTTAATRFIATLISPAPDGSSLGDSYIWNGSETFKPAEVTPSGGDLVFRTAAPLAAGYDNAGHQEIYRYHAAGQDLTCVSCRPLGAAATADASFSELNANLRHSISTDGSRVFFQTVAPLVSADSNDKLDVYQWHDGTVSLISSGTSSAKSQFLSATASGEDVLFSTWQRLAPSDDDEHIDVYDARVNGGFPPPLPPPPTTCSEAGCRGDGTAAGPSPKPGSSTSDTASDTGPAAPRITRISSAQAAKWARTGVLSLRIEVAAAGRVTALAKGRFDGRKRVVARTSRAVRHSGTVALSLRLSKGARSHLARRGRLPLTVVVTTTPSEARARVHLTLRSSRPGPADRRGDR